MSTYLVGFGMKKDNIMEMYCFFGFMVFVDGAEHKNLHGSISHQAAIVGWNCLLSLFKV